MLTRSQLAASLRDAGLAVGDVVMVHTDLLKCGPVEIDPTADQRTAILQFYLDGLLAVLGPEGTLVVPAFTGTHYGRRGKPFDRARTPGEVSAFSEFVRLRTGAMRSLHPIMSLAALGRDAAVLCGGAHYNAFGYDSPWGRLHRRNAKILTIGYGVWPNGMTFLHYFENLYGVPYQYTKLFDTPVLDDGRPVDGDFTMAVRYLDLDVEHDESAFKQSLIDHNRAIVKPLGRGRMLLTTCDDIVEMGMELLGRDRHALLKRRPNYAKGRIPFDIVRDAGKAD